MRRCFPTPYISAANPCALALVQYSTFRFRCRCHVTRTNWSRALAASSVVAQDTTHPHNTSISPYFRERLVDLTPSHTNLRLYRLLALLSRRRSHHRSWPVEAV